MTTGKMIANWEEAFEWHGFSARKGELEGFPLNIIRPPVEKPGRPWIWKTEFLDAFPNADIELVRRGFHLVHLEVFDHFGCPRAVTYGDTLHAFVTARFGFAPKTALLGMSRGGLWAYNWAAKNPEKVALIYGDNPVCDIKSWPGGLGTGPGQAESWQKCLSVYGFTEEEARNWAGNPVDHLEILARAGVPILHVIGDEDETVPVSENSDRVRDRYLALGGRFEEIVKRGGFHHPHGLEDPTPILHFFEQNIP